MTRGKTLEILRFLVRPVLRSSTAVDWRNIGKSSTATMVQRSRATAEGGYSIFSFVSSPYQYQSEPTPTSVTTSFTPGTCPATEGMASMTLPDPAFPRIVTLP